MATVATFVPELALFLGIVLMGWIVAKVLANAIANGLEKVDFGRAVGPGGIKRRLPRASFCDRHQTGVLVAVRELISNTLGGLSYGKNLANIGAVFIIGPGVIAALSPSTVSCKSTRVRLTWRHGRAHPSRSPGGRRVARRWVD